MDLNGKEKRICKAVKMEIRLLVEVSECKLLTVYDALCLDGWSEVGAFILPRRLIRLLTLRYLISQHGDD